MSYAWNTLATASSPEKLKNATPTVDKVAVGTIGKIKVHCDYGIGHAFDGYGAEMFGSYFTPAGCKVLDVYYEGGILSGYGIIEYEVISGSEIGAGPIGFLWAAAIPIVLAAAAALAALGLVLGAVAVLIWGPKVVSEITEGVKWVALAAVGFGIFLVLSPKSKDKLAQGGR
jgi:hypothetical protein